MEFYVYKHTCPNEKIYIGITKQQPIKDGVIMDMVIEKTHYFIGQFKNMDGVI